MDQAILRLLDANFNRAREAIRVMEEHARMILDDAGLTARTKQLRHDLSTAAQSLGLDLMAARDIQHDVGTTITTDSESRRLDAAAVAIAAAKRAEEALRCIEEYGKLIDSKFAASVEQIRYRLYALEQEILLGGPRRARLRRSRLHVLLTAELCRGEWQAVAEQAISGGADVIQLREKSLCDRELLDRGRRLRELTARHGALLIINDRADIARLVDADGVHLGHGDVPIPLAREIVGRNRLIGRSAHRLADARLAQDEGADYIGLGAMFPSPTKPDKPVAGLRLLAEVAPFVSIPIVAIGGITAENASALASSRIEESRPLAYQAAVCQAIIAAQNVAAAARAIKTALMGNVEND